MRLPEQYAANAVAITLALRYNGAAQLVVLPTTLFRRLDVHRHTGIIVMTTAPPEPLPSSVETFFKTLRARTADPVHRRLITAATRANPDAALENELNKIIVELLDEA